MACPAIRTGEQFLAGVLSHVDCQAQTIGSYGYGALADPGSPVALALGSLLAVFVALFGLRLLLGYPMAGRDVVTDAIRVGVVLTLATSWPAWRVLGYDLIIHGPEEVARAIGWAAQLPGSAGDLASRLQTVDAAIAALNGWGSGRLGVATGDWFQLGFARSAFLVGTLAPLALVRLGTGILLALAPLTAGLLLFGATRSLFAGWLRGLAMLFLGSLALSLVYGAELALLEPWLQDALQRRAADQQTLEAPVEVLVVTLIFAVVALGALAMAARIAFNPGSWAPTITWPDFGQRARNDLAQGRQQAHLLSQDAPSRAQSVALAVSDSLRREERLLGHGGGAWLGTPAQGGPSTATAGGRTEAAAASSDALGSSYRRGSRRISAAGRKRDQA